MSGIGFWELILLFLIGLIVLGPERLPRVANQLGTWLGQARRMTRVLKRQLEDELDLEKNSGFRPHPVPQALPHKAVHKAVPPKGIGEGIGEGTDTDTDIDKGSDKNVDKAVPEPREYEDTYSAAHGPDSPGTGVTDTASATAMTGESDDFSDTDVLDETVVNRTVDRDDRADDDKSASGSASKT